MKHPTILVTGATGKTGRAVVAHLRRHDWPVRAVVHRRDARSRALEQWGAEVVEADLFDADDLTRALRGTQRAYYCPPFHPHAIQSAAAFAVAVGEARLEAVVGLSQWLASPDSPSPHTRQLALIDRLLAALPGVAYVTISPGYFADNYLRLADFATLLGVFPILTGHSGDAPPSNEDIGRASAAVLMDVERHAGRRYRPTGPALLSAYDMAAIIGQVTGRRVRPLPMPWWMFERAARLQHVDAFQIASLRHYLEDHRQGAFAQGAPTDDVQTLTGAPAEDFQTTARRYVALPFAQPTAANRLRALLQFSRVPFTAPYGLTRMNRIQAHPPVAQPRHAMASAPWRAAHGPRDRVPGNSIGTPRAPSAVDPGEAALTSPGRGQ